jgi:anthranilate synthase component 1
VRGRDIEVEDNAGIVERHQGDPLAFIGDFLRRYRAAPRPGLPRFCGGLAGYFGYDTVRHIETKLADSAPPAAPELADIPDILLMLTEELAVVDNLSGKISLIVYADPGEPHAHRTAHDRLHQLRRKLREPVSIPYQTASELTHAESEFGAEGYKAAVARSREYIAAGDIMQVVIAQRTRRPFAAPPLQLYRALRSVNPSPYMFYYDFADFHVVGASPEILVRLEGDTVTLRPIAGTPNRATDCGTFMSITVRLLTAFGSILATGGWIRRASRIYPLILAASQGSLAPAPHGCLSAAARQVARRMDREQCLRRFGGSRSALPVHRLLPPPRRR